MSATSPDDELQRVGEVLIPTGKRGRSLPPVRVHGEKWEKVREAYVSRPIRPSYQELATEFAITDTAIQAVASDNGWPMLRAQFMQQKLEESGAGEVIVSAMKSNRAIVRAGENFSIVALRKLLEIVEDIKKESAASTRLGLMNTAGFVYKNISDGCKALGIVGFAKELNTAGKEGNGQWNPNLLNQINITVGKLESARSEVAADVI